MTEVNDAVRFCLICNYISKIDKSLQNECISFKFNTLPREYILNFLDNIVKKEQLVNISSNDIENIITNNGSDIRTMINELQGISQSHQTILSENKIEYLLDYIKSKTLTYSIKKFNSYLLIYNIEKYKLVLEIFKILIKNYELTPEILKFIETILRIDNYYIPEFNNYFISELVTLL